jgi:hypothetical protein
MKKSLILIFSLLCLIVCSCQKDTRLDSIVGSWEVSISYKYDPSIYTEHESEVFGVFYYTFLENGNGQITSPDDATFKQDFTYSYSEKKNAILLTSEGIKSILEIESITDDSFLLHGTGTKQSGNATYDLSVDYKGKRIE